VRFRRKPNSETGELQETWQPKLYLRLILLGLLLAYAIAFILQYRSSVNLHFVFVTASLSLIWALLLSLAIGVLAGILLAQLDRRRRRRRSAE
jgi:uncharacterized integral membrane protein